MPKAVQGITGIKFPLWVRLISSVTGILFAGMGMSSFIAGGSMKSVIIPIFVGAVIIYVTGYERTMYIDENGLFRENSFWGQKKIQIVPWNEISDARIILNKGNRAYVIFHGNLPMRPFTFLSEQEEDLIKIVTKNLGEEDILIER